MSHMTRSFLYMFLFIGLLALAALACGGDSQTADEAPAPTEASTEIQAEEPPAPEDEEQPEQADEEQPSEPTMEPTQEPTPTPVPTEPPSPTPAPVGMSRSAPYSMAELVAAPNWDFQVLEIVRGDAAWQAIQAANQFNDPPPEGMEYVLVKLHVVSTHEDSEAHLIGTSDFDITGEKYIRYSTAYVVEPDPILDAELYAGGEAEGWISYAVSQDEGNLVLIFDELFSFDDDRFRFVSLEEGATLTIPPELANIEPNELGFDRSNPAPLGETIITDDWEITVLEVIRGEPALPIIQETNQFNEPPEDGYEYILVRIHARNIGTKDDTSMLDAFSFESTGSESVVYDTPSVVDPDPVLDFTIYPGAEVEGWITMQAAIGEDGMMLIYEPLFEFLSEPRFLSLE